MADITVDPTIGFTNNIPPQERYPDRKVIISSQYLKFLDLVGVALEHAFNVKCYAYNGVLRDSIRQSNLEAYKRTSDCRTPLLLSGKAGGEGINLPEASIMIQTEVWWNRNAELQLHSRMIRPGQQHTVLIIRLESNFSIESRIIQTQISKKNLNTELMRPIVRTHDTAPEIPEMCFELPAQLPYKAQPS